MKQYKFDPFKNHANYSFSRLRSMVVFVMVILSFILPGQRVDARENEKINARQIQFSLQTTTPDPPDPSLVKARSLLERMSPEERVGQLFLVTFNGTDITPDTEIFDLISNYFIGGVILRSDNDNFTDGLQTVNAATDLIHGLQTSRWDISQKTWVNPITNEGFVPIYAPLFIGISQEGDQYPYDQILSDVTALPNKMAIGATWNPDLATQVGSILGQEMALIGFNLVLGPSLDVLESPHTESATDLGTRTFGGDPFWVAKLGQSYISGIHTGSNNRIAVIATHFPGYGGSDRLPEVEVATVRKNLDELIEFELSPFFAVTGNAPSPESTVDGLLTAHIRYQGFQGNIRATTRPVSFDPQALNLLLKLPELDSWRTNGGLMVSDDLGSQAVRGFYDLTSQAFDMPKRVALNAFLAGNDLLYVDNFSSGELDSFTAAKHTLEFFTQKYREDPAFAQRVNESVLRILALKYRLYGNFIPENILGTPSVGSNSEEAASVVFDVSRQAATLISPTQIELDDAVPDPPNQNDRIVFITDTRLGKQCSTCQEKPLIDKRALEMTVLRLYGPQAGGQVAPSNLVSYSLSELQVMLDSPSGETQIERNLARANWIVFSILDPSTEVESIQTLSQFLMQQPDLFQNKRLIVMAFNAPYFLDATNISKLTAYFGLYSKIPQSIDVAAYLLFREQRAEGNSPVSIPSVGYEISTAVTPDPDQIIPLFLEIPQSETQLQPTTTPEPTLVPNYRIGEIILIRTGVIVDRNGNPVPDGTPVEFIISISNQANPVRQIGATLNGSSQTSYTVTESGTAEIQAFSELAASQIIKIDIPPQNGETPPPATETPTPTAQPTATPFMPPIVSNITPIAKGSGELEVADWVIASLLAACLAWLLYRFLANSGHLHWGIRTGLLAWIGGMLAYIYLLLQQPGSKAVLDRSVSQAVLLFTIIGVILGLVTAGLWRVLLLRGQNKI